MRRHTFWMLGISVSFGLLAVLTARLWLESKPVQVAAPAAVSPQIATRTVVVATAPLKFGDQLTERVLKEVSWPLDAVPAGTFATLSEVMREGKRTVLSTIQSNEPVLQAKVTGAGQRATLSALLAPEMKAVAIRVNDVGGVAGFVVPGDHVDILMTRQKDGEAPRTEIVLQKVKVLAIDQNADDSAAKPSVANAVTLEVDLGSAQKLSVASAIGALSLVLRRAGELVVKETKIAQPQPASAPPGPPRGAEITVFRGSSSQQYTVAIETDAAQAEKQTVAAPMMPQLALPAGSRPVSSRR
jgi:pilus assembly protein CpaB